MNVDQLLEARAKTHGDFSRHAQYTQRIKNVMKDTVNWLSLTNSDKEALEMIAHKIGRILAGNPNEVDHWDDIAGYSKLVANQIRSRAASAARPVPRGLSSEAGAGGLPAGGGTAARQP